MNRFSWVRSQIGPIGIDFGTRFVRMIQLTGHRGQTMVVAYAQREIPVDVHSKGEAERLRAEAVRDMLATGNFIGQAVITAVGWDDMQIRNMRIPNMPEEEIGDVIRFEAADRFGFEPTEAEQRFIIAGDVRQGTEIKQEIIVFGAHSAVIDAHIGMLAELGVHPVAVDVGPCAIFRCFERFLQRNEDHNQVNAFLDLGYSASRVVISRGPNITFVKSIPIGGQRFDELVSEGLDLSPKEAVEVRGRLYRQNIAHLIGRPVTDMGDDVVGETTQRAVLDAIRPALDQLGKEIALCLRYCSVTFRGQRTNEFTVVGGEACNADILQVLSDQVNLPFRTGRATRNIGLEEKLDGADRRTGQPEWAMALGLALKPVHEEAAVAS